MTSQQSQQSQQSSDCERAHPISGAVSTPTPLATPTNNVSGPTPGTRLVIFSALLLPSAVIPLFVLRRSINHLHRKIDELKGATNSLHQQFKSTMLELSVRREQHDQLRAMITETRESLAHLRGETQRMQAVHVGGDQRVRDRIQELVASNRIQISCLRELGTSLADVAAFMQEIELQQGFFTPKVDGRGIERLRFLAMQFEGMGKDKTTADDDKPAEEKRYR